MPQRIVIDTNTNCIRHVDKLKLVGVTHIGRYYTRDSHNSKRLSKAEAQVLSDAGVHLFVVYEDGGHPPLTEERGKEDGLSAYTQAQQVGQPFGSAIYFAHEPDGGYGATAIPGLQAYFNGVRQMLGNHYKVGAYCNGLPLDALLNSGHIDYAWLSASSAYPGSKTFTRWSLKQKLIDKDWDGVSVDTNEVGIDDFGSWSLAPVTEGDAVAAIGPVPPAAGPVPVRTPAEKGEAAPSAPKRHWSDLDLGHVNDLAEQGSRLAAKLRDGWTAFKMALFGTTVVGGGAVTLVDPAKGNAAIVHGWGSQHPFLMLLLGAGGVAVVLGSIIVYYGRGAIRGLVTAKLDGRYTPRGGQQP